MSDVGSGPVVVIGNFDGVHRGHQALIRAAAEHAVPVEVVTFWPHPTRVVCPERAPLLLCGLSERVTRLNDCGVARVHVCDFNQELARQTPAEFADSVLRPLAPRHLVVGENFRFGHGATGTPETLRELGFAVTALPLVRSGSGVVSSSRIRALLGEGDVQSAADGLGRPFTFSGTVVRGFQRGREMGFPTANLPVPPDRMVPADGVYAGWLRRLDQDCTLLPAAISVGTNPTFADVARTVEAHVIDRTDLDLYGVVVEVAFTHRLRGMTKFESVTDLVAQMSADVARARELGRALSVHRP